MFVCVYVIRIKHVINLLLHFICLSLGLGIKNCTSFLVSSMLGLNCPQFPENSMRGWMLSLLERRASITMSQRSRASNPSLRSPLSREIISDSVQLCETAVCFLHIQLTGTNVLLPEIHKTPREVEFWLLNVFHLHSECGRRTRQSHLVTVHCLATWDRRESLNCSEKGSKQYWNLLFGPPPLARKFIQASTVHCETPSNVALIFQIRSSNLTAPSDSLAKASWFNVYPLSFKQRKRNRRQRHMLNAFSRNCFWCFGYVFTNSIHKFEHKMLLSRNKYSIMISIP